MSKSGDEGGDLGIMVQEEDQIHLDQLLYFLKQLPHLNLQLIRLQIAVLGAIHTLSCISHPYDRFFSPRRGSMILYLSEMSIIIGLAVQALHCD